MPLVTFPLDYLGNAPATDLNPVNNQVALLNNQLALLNLRHVIDVGGSYIQAVGSIADEYDDASGVNASGSVNETYDATSDFYSGAGISANLCTGGTPIVSRSFPGYYPASAFNGSTTGLQWADANHGGGSATSDYIGYQFATAVDITRLRMVQTNTTSNGTGTAAIEYSDNGSSWTEAKASSACLADVTFNFSSVGAHVYWRIRSTDTSIQYSWGVYEIEMFGAVSLNMTLVSATFTAETAPTESSLVILHQPVDAVTLNTDILGYISRDAGTTWTLGTLVDAGSFDSTTNILTMNAVDISSQPSGTSMRYKIVTANTKEQRLHGAWLAWS